LSHENSHKGIEKFEICLCAVLGTAAVQAGCCDRRERAARTQSFTMWQQAAIEIKRQYHFIVACSRKAFTGAILNAHPICGVAHSKPRPLLHCMSSSFNPLLGLTRAITPHQW